jgi:uncharacterized protein YfiM (DUF2279 family)
MQKLVDAAKTKFGAENDLTNPGTILGATAAMLTGSAALFTSLMPNVEAEYKTGIDVLAEINRNFADPANENSPGKLFEKAISDANEALKREYIKMQTSATSAFAAIVKAINQELNGLAIDAALDSALEKLQGNKAGSGSSGTAAANTTTSYPVAPTNLTPAETTIANDAFSGAALAAGFNPYATVSAAYMEASATSSLTTARSAAQNLSKASFATQAGKDKFIGQNNKAAYVSNIKKALRFYGYSVDTTDTLSPAAMGEITKFQTKYGISPANGQVRIETALQRSRYVRLRFNPTLGSL